MKKIKCINERAFSQLKKFHATELISNCFFGKELYYKTVKLQSVGPNWATFGMFWEMVMAKVAQTSIYFWANF